MGPNYFKSGTSSVDDDSIEQVFYQHLECMKKAFLFHWQKIPFFATVIDTIGDLL